MYRITRRTYEDNPESTFTPLPRNITPLGMELDPTTGADISNTENKWIKENNTNSRYKTSVYVMDTLNIF